MVPTQWPLACVLEVYHGEDKDVRNAKVNTDVGTRRSQKRSSVA